MARVKPTPIPNQARKKRPALSPEAREQRLIDGTASSQETTHFLKLATQKYREDVELARAQREKAEAQVESIKSGKRVEALYEDAIKAFRDYNGRGDPDEY